MLKPLEQFFCDTCGKVIDDIDKGWVEWLDETDEETGVSLNSNFRICHHNTRCQKLADHHDCSDLPLSEFTGNVGRIQLLSLIDIGLYHNSDYTGPGIKDFREYVEFTRRLTLPYYEEARMYWDQAISDGFISDESEISIYMPDYLQRMIAEYAPS